MQPTGRIRFVSLSRAILVPADKKPQRRKRGPMMRRLGQAIKRRRTELGLSQTDLAHRSGVDRTFVGHIERGEVNMSLETLADLAKIVGVSLSELLAEAEGRRF